MEQISFDEEQQIIAQTSRYAPAASKNKGITGLVISLRLAKTEAQANMVLIVIAVCGIALAAAVWIFGSTHGTKVTPLEERSAAWMQQGNTGTPPGTFMPSLK